MPVDEQAVIRALTQVSESSSTAKGSARRKPVITISRAMGSGGDEIADLVAARLNLPIYNKQVINKVAAEADVHESLINKLHERLSGAADAWLYALMFGKNVTRNDYLRFLVTTIRGLYQSGGLVVGRGANIILAGRDVLRLRIIGSPETCARRVAAQDGEDLEAALKKVKKSNKKRRVFVANMFDHDINDPMDYDLVVNTDYFDSYERIADIIVDTVKAMDLGKPRHGMLNV